MVRLSASERRSRSSHQKFRRFPDETFDQFLGDSVLSEWTIPLRKLRRLKPHSFSCGRAPARPGFLRHARTPRHLLATDERGHEVRRGGGWQRCRARADAELLLLAPHAARPKGPARGIPEVLRRIHGPPVYYRLVAARIPSEPTSSTPARKTTRPPAKPRSLPTTCR